MNEKLAQLKAAGMPYATAATIVGNPAAAGIGSLPMSTTSGNNPLGMAQPGDFFGVREPSDSMMIEQGVKPDLSPLQGLTGFERLQKMQDIGMLNPNVNIYDSSMIYDPERERDRNMMMFEKMNRDIREIDGKLIDVTNPENPRIIYAPEDDRDIKVLPDGTIVDITDPEYPRIIFSPREAQ